MTVWYICKCRAFHQGEGAKIVNMSIECCVLRNFVDTFIQGVWADPAAVPGGGGVAVPGGGAPHPRPLQQQAGEAGH